MVHDLLLTLCSCKIPEYSFAFSWVNSRLSSRRARTENLQKSNFPTLILKASTRVTEFISWELNSWKNANSPLLFLCNYDSSLQQIQKEPLKYRLKSYLGWRDIKRFLEVNRLLYRKHSLTLHTNSIYDKLRNSLKLVSSCASNLDNPSKERRTASVSL